MDTASLGRKVFFRPPSSISSAVVKGRALFIKEEALDLHLEGFDECPH